MPEVVKREVKEVVCQNCGATVRFNKSEAKQVQVHINEYKNYIECPDCKHDVEV